MEANFDILSFTASLTGFDIDKTKLQYIIMRRGLLDVTDFSELSERDIDLLTAECLKIVYTMPTITASKSDSHGDYTRSRGSQTITDKSHIYQWMMSLFRKWGEDPFVENLEGSVQWMD